MGKKDKGGMKSLLNGAIKNADACRFKEPKDLLKKRKVVGNFHQLI